MVLFHGFCVPEFYTIHKRKKRGWFMTPTGTKIDSLSQESRIFAPQPAFQKRAWIATLEDYRRRYEQSLRDPEGFWAEMAGDFFWYHPWTRVLDYDWKDTYEVHGWYQKK